MVYDKARFRLIEIWMESAISNPTQLGSTIFISPGFQSAQLRKHKLEMELPQKLVSKIQPVGFEK